MKKVFTAVLVRRVDEILLQYQNATAVKSWMNGVRYGMGAQANVPFGKALRAGPPGFAGEACALGASLGLKYN